MYELKYKTREGLTPQGKPKVYFCAHKDDVPVFFEPIVSEILACENCSVWYADGVIEYTDLEHLETLAQMQLIVIPVTSKFLRTENGARNVEFKFAVENHIPVLPLMQEDGLIDLFNEKCGDLQYLDKNARDATTLGYREKLKKFLSSVLIGDELAEKIRDAFDAYVFLSYRKKDRKYAQELMRLIHKNDFCRDIAIWYDEFLVPGENFNDAIKKALEKSDLFVLTITPNLVSEVNYIETTEYPLAKQEGKPILPAELVPTDRKRLHEKFAELPDAVDARDETRLSERLLENIKKIAIAENDASPEHNYFIGLAYLGGVDVEVDFEKALSLIEGAANDGLIPAINKLVEMYRNGIGVARDYKKSIEWQEKKIAYLECVYEELCGDKDYIYSLFYALSTCGDFYQGIGDIEGAKKMHERSVKFLEKVKAEGHVFREFILAYFKIGDLIREEGDVSTALTYYEKGLEVGEEILRNTGTDEAKRDVGIGYAKLADSCMDKGENEKAQEYFERNLILWKELLQNGYEVLEVKRDLSIIYNRLGLICLAKDVVKAREYFEQCFAISKELYQETNSAQAKRDLALVYQWLGDTYPRDVERARAYYTEAYHLYEELMEELNSVQTFIDLASSCGRMGSLYELEGNYEDAKRYYRKSLEIGEMLIKDAPFVNIKRDLANRYNLFSGVLKKERNFAEARKYSEKALALYLEIDKSDERERSLRDLSIYYGDLAILCVLEGDLASAEAYMDKAIEGFERLAEDGSRQSRINLALAYLRQGDLCVQKRDVDKSKEIYEKLHAMAEALENETSETRSRELLGLAEIRLALYCGDNVEIRLRKARAIFKKLCTEYPEVQLYQKNFDLVNKFFKKVE